MSNMRRIRACLAVLVSFGLVCQALAVSKMSTIAAALVVEVALADSNKASDSAIVADTRDALASPENAGPYDSANTSVMTADDGAHWGGAGVTGGALATGTGGGGPFGGGLGGMGGNFMQMLLAMLLGFFMSGATKPMGKAAAGAMALFGMGGGGGGGGGCSNGSCGGGGGGGLFGSGGGCANGQCSPPDNSGSGGGCPGGVCRPPSGAGSGNISDYLKDAQGIFQNESLKTQPSSCVTRGTCF